MRKYVQTKKLQPYKIMAVDDDQGILDSLKVVLNRNGYDLKCFTNPLDAIEELKKEHYDLLLLDFIMDDGDVTSLIKEVSYNYIPEVIDPFENTVMDVNWSLSGNILSADVSVSSVSAHRFCLFCGSSGRYTHQKLP